MKRRLLLALVFYMFTNASETTDEYVVFYEDEKTIHKCKREDYLEMMEFMEINEDKKHFKEYLDWEHEEKYDNRREKVVYY